MVGGVVIGVTRLPDMAHVHVADCPHYPKHHRGDCLNPDTCCVYTDAKDKDGTEVVIRLGDSLWWQCGHCYWTPHPRSQGNVCGVDYDIRLRKIGYSH